MDTLTILDLIASLNPDTEYGKATAAVMNEVEALNAITGAMEKMLLDTDMGHPFGDLTELADRFRTQHRATQAALDAAHQAFHDFTGTEHGEGDEVSLTDVHVPGQYL